MAEVFFSPSLISHGDGADSAGGPVDTGDLGGDSQDPGSGGGLAGLWWQEVVLIPFTPFIPVKPFFKHGSRQCVESTKSKSWSKNKKTINRDEGDSEDEKILITHELQHEIAWHQHAKKAMNPQIPPIAQIE